MSPQTWKNRIIGEGDEAPDQLLANPKNARRHPQAQQQALADVLDEVGVVQRVIVNQRTGYVVDGHARIALALRQGQPTIPVLYVDLDEREEALILATLDPISAMATTDAAALDELLRDVHTGSAALQTMLDDLATEAGLYLPNDDGPPVDAEPQISRADELRAKWGTEAGQLWKLGEHRLVVGDCTDAAVVERVMGGERAEMVWTDPPYGVAIGDKNKMLNAIGRSNRVEQNLAGDTLDEVGLAAMLAGAFDNAIAVCEPGASWYVAAPPGPLHVIFGQALKDRGIWRQTIQWVKNNSTFSPLGVSYHWASEPIFYGWLPNAGHRYHGDRKQTTVWEIDRPVASPEHPTMKPVELVARAVEHASLPGQVVYEPFSGSGTTLIACEQLGRRCRAVEIDPGYAAVTLQRWADATGGTPELIG